MSLHRGRVNVRLNYGRLWRRWRVDDGTQPLKRLRKLLMQTKSIHHPKIKANNYVIYLEIVTFKTRDRSHVAGNDETCLTLPVSRCTYCNSTQAYSDQTSGLWLMTWHHWRSTLALNIYMWKCICMLVIQTKRRKLHLCSRSIQWLTWRSGS